MHDIRPQLEAILARSIAGFEALTSATRLSGGASQETYRLDLVASGVQRTMALRRASGGEGINWGTKPCDLAVEAQVMVTARKAGVPEPEILYVLTPEDGLGSGFIMEWLEGETMGSRIVRSPELEGIRPRLAYECGRVLARIHSIDVAAAGLSEHLETVPTERFVRHMWEEYQTCGTPQPMIDYTARWLLDHVPPCDAFKLVHNDFRNGNLIVTPEGIAAVLDWELAHIGDPVRDLGWICTNSWRFGRSDLPVGGFGYVEDLLAGYEDGGGIRVDLEHLRFWEVFGSFWWAVACLRMAEQWRHGPDPTVERPAIGRRSSESQADCVNLLIPGPVELVTEGEPPDSLGSPRIDELLTSVRDFLRAELRPELEGRNKFLALVASNSVEVALRELLRTPAHRAAEQARLKALLGWDGALDDLRWELVHRLREGGMGLHSPGLADYLRATVMNQLAIDQPTYSALQTALDYDLRKA